MKTYILTYKKATILLCAFLFTSLLFSQQYRYIRVQKSGTNPGGGYINIAEIEVIDIDGTTNRALAGTATLSSTGFGGVASRGNDGNTNGNWGGGSVFHSGNANSNEWWEIDLGALYTLSHINIYNRTNCCSNRLSNMYVMASDTPFDTSDADLTNLTSALNSSTFVYQLGPISDTSMQVINIPDYCTSIGTRNPYDTNTTLVSFGDINNNTTSDDRSPYHGYTWLSNNIELGASEGLTVNVDTDGNYRVYVSVWIDWNSDGDFDDVGEIYDLGDAVNTDNGPTSNSPLSITVPTDAILGDTRMRVISQWNIAPSDSCAGSNDGEVEDYTITILPGIEYTYNNAWLPSDPNGVATIANNITVINGTANFNTTTDSKNIIVNPEGSITIDNGVTLTIDGEMTLESSSTRYASLISDGIIIGDVVYKRHINNAAGTGLTTTANDLVSAPLTGQTFGAFRTTNTNILSGNIGGSPAFLYGPFNPLTETYVNYSSSDDLSTLDAGNGYRTGSTDGATYTFTGTIETSTVNKAIVAGGMSNWNLIGNPYPSYLKVQDFLNNVSNAGLLDEDAVGIYGYDGTATDGWIIYNLATTTASTVITPGQGFFVDAESSGNIQFTPSMRSTGTDDDFIAGRNLNTLIFLKLNVSNTTNNYNTDFYFNDNATLGLDQGYDATVWNDTAPSFSVYSNLVENNTGKAMALQALHSSDLLNVTIPLGVNTNTSSDIVFTISESTIPENINVYLEDAVENTSTLLTAEDYIVRPNSALSGTGRFYLRFVANQLNVKEIELEALNIFTNYSQKTIVIEGKVEQQTSFQLFDVHGRLVTNTALMQQSNRQIIDVSQLTSGIYVIKLKNNTTTKTQKVVLK